MPSGVDIQPACPAGQIPNLSQGPPASRAHQAKGNPLLRPQNDRRTPPGTKSNRFFQFKDVHGKLTHRRRLATQICGPDPEDTAATSCFYYGGAYTWVSSDGAAMMLSINDPHYSNPNASGHTLNEVSVQGQPPNTDNIVELGWLVSTDTNNNSSDPFIFVSQWKNGTWGCNNGCGWQQYSSKYYPGQNISLLKGHDVYAGYVFYRGNWWAWFDNEWLGYFPGSLWDNNFSRSTINQWFGEVSYTYYDPQMIAPKIQMGSGSFPTVLTAAHMLNVCKVDAQAWKCSVIDIGTNDLVVTDPSLYSIKLISPPTSSASTRYGGPGKQ
jgi:hypothetical protein